MRSAFEKLDYRESGADGGNSVPCCRIDLPRIALDGKAFVLPT